MIYYINNFHLLYTCNYNTHINEWEQLVPVHPEPAAGFHAEADRAHKGYK